MFSFQTESESLSQWKTSCHLKSVHCKYVLVIMEEWTLFIKWKFYITYQSCILVTQHKHWSLRGPTRSSPCNAHEISHITSSQLLLLKNKQNFYFTGYDTSDDKCNCICCDKLPEVSCAWLIIFPMCVISTFIETLYLATISTGYNSADTVIGQTKHRWVIPHFQSASPPPPPPPPFPHLDLKLLEPRRGATHIKTKKGVKCMDTCHVVRCASNRLQACETLSFKFMCVSHDVYLHKGTEILF